MEIINVIRYKAIDGKECKTEQECLEYEKQLDIKKKEYKEKEEKMKKAAALKVNELTGLVPINKDKENSSYYYWYKLSNESDFEAVNSNYRNMLNKPTKYPTMICIEVYDTCQYESTELEEMKNYTDNFWNNKIKRHIDYN